MEDKGTKLAVASIVLGGISLVSGILAALPELPD